MTTLKESSRETIRYRTLIDSITDHFDEQISFTKDEKLFCENEKINRFYRQSRSILISEMHFDEHLKIC